MPSDALAGLFKRKIEIDIPGGQAEQAARQLAKRGLVRAREQTYVRCVDPRDDDRSHIQDLTCCGRIYLSPGRDEHNGDYQCPICGRLVQPSRKHRCKSLRLVPDRAAMGAVVAEHLDRAHIEFDERPRGLYRVPAVDGEVLIALVDVCEDASVFSEPNASARVIFVLGNALDYRRRLPARCLVFRLVDLILGEATPVFLREIRDLLRQASRLLSASGPAIARVAPPTPRGPPAVATVSSGDRAAVSVPDGTSWSEVTIYLVDGETIAVQVHGQRLRRYRHYELGMSDRRSGKPCKKWRVLEQLCENYGTISWSGAPSEFGAFKERVSGLRRTLQRAFGIAANPIPTCSRRHGLRAAFRAFPDLDNEPLFETRT